ncbi:hypothetical protein HY837_03420 [archaeon]|nr:hypothetical protein [archaeon]
MRVTFKGLKSRPRLFYYGLVSLLLSPTCAYTADKIYNSSFPSRERKEFVEQFKIPLEGYRSDIEKENRIGLLTQVLLREKFTRDFDLEKIVVLSDNILKRDFGGQRYYFNSSSTEAAHTIPRDEKHKDILRLEESKPDFFILAVHHEIKHTKTFDVLEEDPNFEAKWKANATENGKTLYLEDISVLKAIKITQKELEQQGFVSVYSKLNWMEDLAEFCANAELNPDKFYSPMYEHNNQRFINKVNLAQEKRLIPQEFSQYLLVRNLYRQSFVNEKMNPARAREFLAESEKLLGSIYECELRERRGMIMTFFSQTQDSEFTLEDAIKEHKKGLLADYKDVPSYTLNLISLQGCYVFLRDYKTAEIYGEAKKEYPRNSNGVNDFLKERGIKIK